MINFFNLDDTGVLELFNSFIEGADLSFSSKFIPNSLVKSKGERDEFDLRNFNWDISIKGKNLPTTFTFPYSKGAGLAYNGNYFSLSKIPGFFEVHNEAVETNQIVISKNARGKLLVTEGESCTAPTIGDVLFALSSDALCYEENATPSEFLLSLGYSNPKEGLVAFYSCKKSSEKIKKLFSGNQATINCPINFLYSLMTHMEDRGLISKTPPILAKVPRKATSKKISM